MGKPHIDDIPLDHLETRIARADERSIGHVAVPTDLARDLLQLARWIDGWEPEQVGETPQIQW